MKAWFETHDTLTLGEFRDALGTSRDHALLVLEYYDRRGILRREGDVRRPGAQFGEIEKCGGFCRLSHGSRWVLVCPPVFKTGERGEEPLG